MNEMTMRTLLWTFIAAILLAGCGSISNPAVTAPSVRAAARQNAHAAYKIYVANIGNGTITTYDGDGTQTTPTISTGNYLFAIAVAPTGKLYALTFDPLLGPNTSGTITSYEPNGAKTTPTITIKERGYRAPVGIAVDRRGKIYVLSSAHNGSRGTVTTYKADGTPSTPTFRTGADSSAIAIDENGKIYVANDAGPNGKSTVTTYFLDGAPATPTLYHDVHQPAAVAVAPNGMIFVANTNNRGPDGTGAGSLMSYSSGGAGPLHTIRDREAPGGLWAGGDKVYLASSSAYSSVLKTYTLEGQRVSPTIESGLDEPSGIALSR